MNGRLIIIEGPDACGKTTLAREMCKQKASIYFHATASEKLFPALEDYHKNLLANAVVNIQNGLDVVFDRFWPSEYVYGLNMFRPHSGYNPSKLRDCIKDMGGLYVFCFSRNGLARYTKGHSDPAHALTPEQYKRMYASYKACYEQQKQQGDKVANYIIEEDGLDDASMARKIQGYYEYAAAR